MDAPVRCGERVVGRQGGLVVCTAEVDGAGVAGHHVAVGILHRHGEAKRRARGVRKAIAAFSIAATSREGES